MMNHPFFQSFGMPTQPKTEEQNSYSFNCTVLEMASNWIFVKELMNKYKNGELSHVDPLERDWFNFLLQNKIDIDQFENEDIFIKHHLKIK